MTAAAAGEVEVIDSRRMGGAWMLGQLWERLETGRAIRRVAAGRRLDGEATERVIFALAGELVALARGPGVRAADEPFEVGDEPLPHGGVTLGGLGVVADHEPLGPDPVAPGRSPHLLDPQVPGHGVVAALAGQRRGGPGVGVAELVGGCSEWPSLSPRPAAHHRPDRRHLAQRPSRPAHQALAPGL